MDHLFRPYHVLLMSKIKNKSFNRAEYDQFTQQNKQNQQGPSKFGIPKYNFNNNQDDNEDSDGDSVMFNEYKKANYDNTNDNHNHNHNHNDQTNHRYNKVEIDKKGK